MHALHFRKPLKWIGINQTLKPYLLASLQLINLLVTVINRQVAALKRCVIIILLLIIVEFYHLELGCNKKMHGYLTVTTTVESL